MTSFTLSIVAELCSFRRCEVFASQRYVMHSCFATQQLSPHRCTPCSHCSVPLEGPDISGTSGRICKIKLVGTTLHRRCSSQLDYTYLQSLYCNSSAATFAGISVGPFMIPGSCDERGEEQREAKRRVRYGARCKIQLHKSPFRDTVTGLVIATRFLLTLHAVSIRRVLQTHQNDTHINW